MRLDSRRTSRYRRNCTRQRDSFGCSGGLDVPEIMRKAGDGMTVLQEVLELFLEFFWDTIPVFWQKCQQDSRTIGTERLAVYLLDLHLQQTLDIVSADERGMVIVTQQHAPVGHHG